MKSIEYCENKKRKTLKSLQLFKCYFYLIAKSFTIDFYGGGVHEFQE